ncbi:hypothetical protein [Jannaschia sp. W003]|uniref:hypothetical protein n=1 Tax=Jannaschia sp. W003 TaxID=2867012 RepID=UPI0021A6FF0A|nr:hypothetical protein [Jannaschia sp. W003]UWQ21341.1 hypothetical protein K3554_15445 [Jannaschia sp. W003]
MPRDVRPLLKRRTELLVKSVGVEAACAAIGKSKATLGRYYSVHDEHRDRFIPVDSLALLEEAARRPIVTLTLCELAGVDTSDAEAESAPPRRLRRALAEHSRILADGGDALERRALLAELRNLEHMLHDLRVDLGMDAEAAE